MEVEVEEEISGMAKINGAKRAERVPASNSVSDNCLSPFFHTVLTLAGTPANSSKQK